MALFDRQERDVSDCVANHVLFIGPLHEETISQERHVFEFTQDFVVVKVFFHSQILLESITEGLDLLVGGKDSCLFDF